jgi:hypothetical protein
MKVPCGCSAAVEEGNYEYGPRANQRADIWNPSNPTKGYVSDSFTDLQAMYGSIAAAGKRETRTSASRLFRVTVEATALQ